MRPVLALMICFALGCDSAVDTALPDAGVTNDIAGKGIERVVQTGEWRIADSQPVACLGEGATVTLNGYANYKDVSHTTPSGNWVDMLHFDFDTDEPYSVSIDGDPGPAWLLVNAEDNSGWFTRNRGNTAGLLTWQANMMFAQQDGPGRLHWRSHGVVDAGFNTFKRYVDEWTCINTD